MKDSNSWLNMIKCPDCHSAVKPGNGHPDTLQCARCSRFFENTDGIWNLLPSRVINQALKDREKQGWTQKTNQSQKAGWDPPPEHFLSLPNHPQPFAFRGKIVWNSAKGFGLKFENVSDLQLNILKSFIAQDE